MTRICLLPHGYGIVLSPDMKTLYLAPDYQGGMVTTDTVMLLLPGERKAASPTSQRQRLLTSTSIARFYRQPSRRRYGKLPQHGWTNKRPSAVDQAQCSDSTFTLGTRVFESVDS
jgi:hypothetical protein